MKKHFARFATIAGISIGLLLTQTASSFPASTHLGGEEISQPEAWLIQNGVEASTASALAASVEQGHLLDSMTDAEPVATNVTEEDGWLVSRAEFEDGSVSVSRLEMPQAETTGIGARAVGTCAQVNSGSYWVQYNECAIYGSNGYLEISFRADYNRASGGSGISSIYSPYQYANAGTATTPVLQTVRSTGNASKEALATATSQYSSKAVSFTAVLRLHVSPASAWTSQSF